MFPSESISSCTIVQMRRWSDSLATSVCTCTVDSLGGHRRKSHEDSAARYRVGEDRVGDMQRIEHLKIDAAVQASEIAEIQLVLGLAGRNLRVIGVIETNQ